MGYKPSITVLPDGTTITPNANADLNILVSTQGAGTLTVNNPSGQVVEGQTLTLRIKSNGAQTYSWGTQYRGGTTTLPTASTASKTDYVVFRRNQTDNKWDCVATSATNY